ncbi:MAG: hypothetical protein QNJ87_07665, partial [Gammaproteobacteria bacterium]|nr:hypothetical protein [Gammaproteobacteria bacterium]
RWQLLNLSMYQRLQPAFVETSEKLAEDLDVVKARDHLWKEVSAQRTAIAGQILDEGIATSYVSLLAHFPEVRSQFIALFQRLNDIEEKISSAFLTASQDDVLAFETRGASYTSAMLGNALRTTAEAHRTRLEEETTTTFKPHKDFLLDVIGKDNKEILRGSRSR